MAATSFGGGFYGALAEVGTTFSIYVASVSFNSSTEQAVCLNHQGEGVGVSFYNETGELTINGMLSSTHTTGGAVATAYNAAAIVNSDVFANDSNCTVFYGTGVSLTLNQAGFQEGSVTMMGWVGITALT